MCLAIPGQILEVIPGPHPLALVDVSGVRRKVELALLDDPAAAGEWVLIHAGFAMTRISEQAAMEQLRLLTMMGEEPA